MQDPSAAAIRALQRQVARAKAGVPNRLTAVVDSPHTAIAGEADAYLLLGVLVEGIVQTLAVRVPTQRRGETAAALIDLLLDRMRAARVR